MPDWQLAVLTRFVRRPGIGKFRQVFLAETGKLVSDRDTHDCRVIIGAKGVLYGDGAYQRGYEFPLMRQALARFHKVIRDAEQHGDAKIFAFIKKSSMKISRLPVIKLDHLDTHRLHALTVVSARYEVA